jgi:hypothetical protein
MSWQVQQGIHFCDSDLFRTLGDSYDVIACADLSFLQHAKVKSWSSMGDKQGGHARLVQADADAVAGYARLGHFEYCSPNAVSVTDRDLVIGKSFNGEVLAELAKSEIRAPQKVRPVMVRIHLVDKYGALLSAMTGEIPLPIAINIEFTYHRSSIDRRFPDRRSDSLALPCHVMGETDVH